MRSLKISFLLTIALSCPSFGADHLTRIESQVDFRVDEKFLDKNGVQFFCDVITAGESPFSSDAFRFAGRLDKRSMGPTSKEPLHIMVMRSVFDVQKPLSFFSKERAWDLAYMNAILPEYKITQTGANTFHTEKMPASDFIMRYTPAPNLTITQENFNFESFLGMRTVAKSWLHTTHVDNGDGTTRIDTVTLAYLHTLPPGAEGFVVDQARKESGVLVRNLRAYQPR